MDRRSVLALLGGGAGVLGLGGYHQRRRLRRWSDRDALGAAQESDYRTVESPTHLRPTEDHLADALDQLAERVDAVRERWPDEEIEADDREILARSGRRYERAKATLEDIEERRGSFGELSAAERLDVLADLRTALGGAEQAVALADLQGGDRERDDVMADLEALYDEYETVREELRYVAPDLSWAVTAYGELDERLDEISGSIRTSERYVYGEGSTDIVEPQYSAARAATARARLADVVRFRDSIEETAREDPSADSLEQELDDAYEKKLVALAVRRKVEHHAYALVLPEFDDEPATQQAGASVPEFDTTGADVRDAKDRAAAALDDRLRTDGDDPLVRHLCAMLVERFEQQERRLDRHLDAINDDSPDEWAVGLERTRLRYREIEELAATVPDAVATVTDNNDKIRRIFVRQY